MSDISGHKAGDVDPGRAWRKKRPSNVVSRLSPHTIFWRVCFRTHVLGHEQHDIKRSASTVSVNSRRAREHSGQLFVCRASPSCLAICRRALGTDLRGSLHTVRDVTFEGVPMPRERVNVSAALDNGRQRVEAAVRELAPKVSLKKEFEL